MTKNCWNSQALAEISCYLAFAGAMLYLVRSGRYLSYVTPKLAPYLCFSAAVMVVWALSSLGRVFRIQYRKHIAHCFVLAIPLLLLLLPHDTVGLRDISDSAGLLNGSMVSGAAGGGGGIPATGSPIPSNQEDTEAEGPAQAEASADGYTTLDAYGAPLELHGYNSRQQTITVSNEEFYDWLCVFYTDIEQLEGFQVTMTGQVYKHAGYGGQRVCSRTAGHGLLRGGPVPLRPVLHLRQRVRTGERFLGHGDRYSIRGAV